MIDVDYERMFVESVLTKDPSKIEIINKVCSRMIMNQIIYSGIESATGVPWYVIAGIHYRESSQNFNCHLHNGDPLTDRTIHVPKGRPVNGSAPFTWSASAIDALSDRWQPDIWDVNNTLLFCEHYNGLGYQRHNIASPYLWSGTSLYSKGLFVSDGTLDLTKSDQRPGIVALFKTLIGQGIILDTKDDTTSSDLIH